MNYENVYIDYFPGSHGRFLEYLINRYIYKIPNSDIMPFTPVGSSHIPLMTAEYQNHKHASSGHFSYDFINDPYNPLAFVSSANWLSIKIQVDSFYLIYYNNYATVNNHNIDLENLEVNTYNKLNQENIKHFGLLDFLIKEFGTKENYSRDELSLMFDAFGKHMPSYRINKWKNYNDHEYYFPMSAFFDYDKLTEQLQILCEKITGSIDIPDFKNIWDQFMDLNKAYKSYTKIQKILDNLTAFEHAYITKLLYKQNDIQPY